MYSSGFTYTHSMSLSVVFFEVLKLQNTESAVKSVVFQGHTKGVCIKLLKLGGNKVYTLLVTHKCAVKITIPPSRMFFYEIRGNIVELKLYHSWSLIFDSEV